MTDHTRTAFAAPPQARLAAACPLLIFPADRIVRPPAQLGPDEIRVEYQGRSKVYRDRAHLERELLGRRADLEERARSWGWLLVLALCAAAVVRGAL